MIPTVKKEKILVAMNTYMATKQISGNRLAAELKARGIQVSSATISQIKNRNWKSISDAMWIKLQRRFLKNSWGTYETRNFNRIQKLCTEMQERSEVAIISDYAGAGKTHGLETYAGVTENAFYVCANQLMTLKDLLFTILQTVGGKVEAKPYWMTKDIVGRLGELENPLLIIDEVDKLVGYNLAKLSAIKVIYDELEYHCGFVLAGTPALLKKINGFVKKDQMGAAELKRRFFTNVQKLVPFDTSKKKVQDEIRVICEDQGVTDPGYIQDVLFSQCTNWGDVRTLVMKYHRLEEKGMLLQEAA